MRGIKFNPLSLENHLEKSVANIGECVVFGTDKVKCIYTGDCTVDDIKKLLVELNAYCKPQLIKQVEKIPMSPSGKLSRIWLDSYFSI